MNIKFSLVNLGIVLFLVGCFLLQITFVQASQAIGIQLKTKQLSNFQVSQEGQVLPITAQAEISGQVINLEVAKTPQEQAMGLMYRTELADDQGMLFSFDPPRKVNFWMKNCQIYLDMIFIRSGLVKAIAVDVPPCLSDPCPTYGSGVPVDQVIEVRGRRTTQLGLKVGDQIVITEN
ncbi:DUF192 domain-containing protein [Okeania sp.]|uniref:DUF192 domain-containing protein n=1 Tax=Okeania sp. TaxID=3100323 RepID=UPI002B4B57AD|nr:DUF192 domain-containing protein [Okeania sp.]MEB3343287.1 DUF192 domain-containing protein [Okeania sp.]